MYWNSNNHTDREAVLKMIGSNDTVCDMFCGVGPLSLLAAKKGARVIANDLNPACFKYLKENIRRNKLVGRVIPFGIDAREFFVGLSRHPETFLRRQQQINKEIYPNIQ